MASPHLAEQVGRVLDGRYRVIAPIGTGASAAVYLADDTTLRRRVALKVLHAALASDQGFLKRFEAEAHTAAALSHPNIMRVLDWGEGTDGPFLVLEYLGGGSLRAVLDREGTLSLSQATQIGIQGARALDYAHRRGLVHRDIKPANLLFDDEGRLAIADFGLARALAEAAWTEPGGAVLGTARYAAPEQVRGHSLDSKADVYALGLLLFEAVTGRVPFTADTTIATLMGRLDARVEIPGELGELGSIIEASTHPEPTARIGSDEMLRALESSALTLPSAEKIAMPGAISIDIRQSSEIDRTMLPGIEPSTEAVSVEARPMPKVPRQRRRIPRPFKRTVVAGSMARPNGELSKKRRLRKPSVKQAVVGLIIIVLLAAASGSAYALYYFTGSQVPVPALEAMTLDQARATAEQSDVNLEFVGEEYNEDVPVGLTFGQSPSVGTEIFPRQAASIKVSRGPAPRVVPSVAGLTWAEAVESLESERFRVARQDRADEQVPRDRVMEQSPAADSEQARDSEVTLVVSSGPRARIVPNVTGQNRDAAIAAISAEQLQVNVREEFSNSVPAGQVAGTQPGSGASLQRGATVTILISRGPDLVAVPNVIGQSVSGATSTLRAAGFAVNDVNGPPDGTVFRTLPDVGRSVNRGATIALYTE